MMAYPPRYFKAKPASMKAFPAISGLALSDLPRNGAFLSNVYTCFAGLKAYTLETDVSTRSDPAIILPVPIYLRGTSGSTQLPVGQSQRRFTTRSPCRLRAAGIPKQGRDAQSTAMKGRELASFLCAHST